MNRFLAALTLTTALAAWPAAAQTGAPEPAAEPRSYLTPTDESEPAARTPPVTHPKPMERTRMGVPADADTPPRSAPAERADPAPKTVAQPRRAAAPRQTAQRRTAPPPTAPPRHAARPRQQPDTSLSTIFSRPRADTSGPPAGLAPQGGPRAERPRADNYAAAPLSPSGDVPCPARAAASLRALFACAR